ncbi:hypothetical protein BGX30_009957 [Mortierella sp. GBA39]|nr:hypothetical protein BGX30_009957 [Mortierella sp. GBA39]
MLHLSEYSILAAGPEISRKSKLAFRLSSPEPIPHQQQHHVFFTESAQSLHNWFYSLQLHINHATATWFPKAATSSATGLGLQQTGGPASGGISRRMGQGGVVPGQSIIDKVLDRLHLDDPSTAGEPGAPTGSMSDSTITSTVKDQPRLPYIPPNFSQSHEDNNDTWSSTSSMPNTSTNTSTNLEYIFSLTQQNQASKSSMDSIRGGNDRSEQQAHSQGSPIVSGGASHQPIHPTPLSYATSSTGYAGSTFTDQSSVTSEAIRFSADYQGRSSLHLPRPSPGAGNGFLVGSASPHMYPIRSSIHSGLSAENDAGSPSTSVTGSPFASPTLSSQHPSVLSSSNNNSGSNNNHHSHSHTESASPRTFYRVLENSSPSKRAESIASSASISTIASSGDVSTINDLNSENGLSSTATDSSLPSKPKSAGATILGLVTGGGKHKKDKKDGSNAGSNHSGSGSGSGSSGLKLFGSGVCHYSGCTQMAKTCTFHNKKFRPESPNAIASRKAKEEKKAAKETAKETAKEEKKAGKSSLWSSSSDKSGSQGNISEISSPIMMKADGSLLTNYNGGSGRGLSSRSMVSLPRDAEFGIDPSTVPLPPLHLRSLASSPTRRRSPSVSVLEESFSQQSQQQDYNRPPEISSKSNGGYSMRPQTPLSAAPSQPLPPPPPRAPSSASNHRPGSNNKETFSLSRKMGLQMGSEFGAVEKTALSGTALDGNYFVANHHRTMQKLQLSRKPQPLQQQQQFIDQQQLQQQQQQQYQQQQSELFKGVGVSRHIVAPDELAMAIEMEAEEMRRRQAELQETQKSRPTSMVKGGGAYHSVPIQLHLATVSESSALSDGADEAESGLQGSQTPPQQDGGKIISAQEQMAYAPHELPTTIKSDRSPISGFTAGISPLSPNPGSQLPPAASLGVPLSEFSNTSPGGGRGGSTNSSNHGSPRSNSLSAGSGDSPSSVPSSSGLPAPLSSLPRRQMSSSPGLGSRHPMSPMNASFMEEEDRSDFHMRSLPPPKRHTNDHLFKGDSNGIQRNELPRRSSAAAAVTLSATENGPRSGPLSDDQHGGPTPSSSSGAPGTSLRPAYMARRQSSSPVLIRVSGQGGQNISPLLTGGATRTFAGDAPSREVIRRPSELTTPLSSVEGSPAPSTSTGSSSMCSLVTSRYTGQDASPMSPSQDASISSLPSPTSVPGRVYRTASSPLASVTPADGCTPSTSPAPNSALQMPGEPINTTHPALISTTPSPAPYRSPAVVNEDIPSVVVNSPRASSTFNVVGQEPAKRVLHNVSSFRFPAPSQDATEVDSNSRPLSSCSSASLYSSASENFGAHEEEDHHTSMDEGYRSRQQQHQQQQHQQQRRGSNGLYHDGTHSPGGGISPSLHAAALGLYPGLRKLSLFTAAAGDHPPPPLLSGRKDSAGSSVSTRDYHHGVTSPTLSIMEDGDEVTTEEEDLDLHNDEDWAGNMKSMRRGYHQDPPIVVSNAALTGEAPVRVVVDSLPLDGLAAPPLTPLPLTPPHPTAPPPRPSSSAMKAPPVTPGSYYFPTSPSVPLPPTPPVSDSIPPVLPSKNPLALAVATQGGGVPPMIPPRSPHRSVPGSPTALRSMRSYQNLVSPPLPPSGA